MSKIFLTYAKSINQETKELETISPNWQEGLMEKPVEAEISDKDFKCYLKGYAPMKTDQDKKKEANVKRISEIDLELTDVDSKSTRSLRDFALNFGKIGKEAILKEAIGYLVKYNDRALQLREERAKLLKEVSLL